MEAIFEVHGFRTVFKHPFGNVFQPGAIYKAVLEYNGLRAKHFFGQAGQVEALAETIGEDFGLRTAGKQPRGNAGQIAATGKTEVEVRCLRILIEQSRGEGGERTAIGETLGENLGLRISGKQPRGEAGQ